MFCILFEIVWRSLVIYQDDKNQYSRCGPLVFLDLFINWNIYSNRYIINKLVIDAVCLKWIKMIADDSIFFAVEHELNSEGFSRMSNEVRAANLPAYLRYQHRGSYRIKVVLYMCQVMSVMTCKIFSQPPSCVSCKRFLLASTTWTHVSILTHGLISVTVNYNKHS